MDVWTQTNPVASYTDYAPHIRHPWLAKPCMKRQHSSSPSDTESNDNERRLKRRKYTNFERGFSRLSLGGPLRNSSPSAGSSSAHSSVPEITEIELPHTDVPIDGDGTTPMDLDTPRVEVDGSLFPTPTPTPVYPLTVKPTSVEEPGFKSPSLTLPAPDVHMKGMHSYEVGRDRIVITDLDTSSDEEDLATNETDGIDTSSITVSPALLQRLRQRQFEQTPIPLTPGPSQALVLFKPSPPLWKSSTGEEDDAPSSSLPSVRPEYSTPVDTTGDDDAMDVEPI